MVIISRVFESKCCSERDRKLWKLRDKYETITLVSGTYKISVHPLILSAYGGYLETLLDKNDHTKEIDVTNIIPGHLLESVIELLYMGSCNLPNAYNIGELVMVFDTLLLSDLVSEIVHWIMQDPIEVCDSLDIYLALSKLSNPSATVLVLLTYLTTIVNELEVFDALEIYLELWKKPRGEENSIHVIQYVLSMLDYDFMSLKNAKEFLELSYSDLHLICTRDTLWLPNEDMLCVMVHDWIQYNVADRAQYIEDLLDSVIRTPFVSSAYLESFPKATQPPNRKRKRNDWVPRSGIWDHTVRIQEEYLIEFQTYDPNIDKEYKVSLSLHSMNIPRKYFGFAFMDGIFYVFGGQDSQERPLDSIERYDFAADKWYLLEERLLQPRAFAFASYCGVDRILITGTHIESEWFHNGKIEKSLIMIPQKVYDTHTWIRPLYVDNKVILHNDFYVCISNTSPEGTEEFHQVLKAPMALFFDFVSGNNIYFKTYSPKESAIRFNVTTLKWSSYHLDSNAVRWNSTFANECQYIFYKPKEASTRIPLQNFGNVSLLKY